jgi:hypothetical protein
MKQVDSKAERDKPVIEPVARRFGPVARVQIYELTHLRKTTISNLVCELLHEGKLVESGPADNRMGRKQTLLQLNRGHGFVVRLEFDEDKVAAGMLDLHPHILQIIKEPTDLAGGLQGLLKQLQLCACKVIRKSKVSTRSVIGIGIADPGPVDSRRGITTTLSTIEFWKQVPLRQAFEAEVKIPMVVESETRAKSGAERMNRFENFIYR